MALDIEAIYSDVECLESDNIGLRISIKTIEYFCNTRNHVHIWREKGHEVYT